MTLAGFAIVHTSQDHVKHNLFSKTGFNFQQVILFQKTNYTPLPDLPAISKNTWKDPIGLTTKNLLPEHYATFVPLRLTNCLSKTQATILSPFQKLASRQTRPHKAITLHQKPFDYQQNASEHPMQCCKNPLKIRAPIFLIKKHEIKQRVFVPDFTVLLYSYFY